MNVRLRARRQEKTPTARCRGLRGIGTISKVPRAQAFCQGGLCPCVVIPPIRAVAADV